MVLTLLIIDLKIMKNKISFILFILFFNVNAQKNLYRNKKLVFDNQITQIQHTNIKFNKKIKDFRLEESLVIFPFEKNKLNIGEIKFEDYSNFPVYWNYWTNPFFKDNLGGFCYGKKKIFDNNLLLYSVNFKNYIQYLESGTIGLLLIENKSKIKCFIKVFEDKITNIKSLESFLFDNYIFVVETTYTNSDKINTVDKKEDNYKYMVYELKYGGNIVELNKIDSEKIKENYLK